MGIISFLLETNENFTQPHSEKYRTKDQRKKSTQKNCARAWNFRSTLKIVAIKAKNSTKFKIFVI